ncbi:nucleotide modification associated domain-containing protein [Lactobacillus intestinalis]|uniref:nucleotide modification associated domain-containing protein n=1 Tax=Lactobacillus intestinalis TaxID=151781 RepID=UPI0024311552|nr:nucleotide modification associated domain-containing protein [Lactobacillus intestinalis]
MCGNIFQKYTDNLANVLQSKNKAYGDSFTKSVDKYNRIEHLITNNELKENDESLEDTLLDMAGYSILALRYLKEHKDENYRG